MRIQITENGPYVVTGGIPLAEQTIVVDAEGTSRDWRRGREYPVDDEYRLCRCGRSENKPFCDGHHVTAGFDGTETAPRVPYLTQATEQDGPELALTDAEGLCAFARFCDADGQIWNQVEQAGQADRVEKEAGQCVGGRLVAWKIADEKATPLESDAEPSIGVVQDPGQGVAAGYRVWGGVQITGSDGYEHELRNRVALCRCGASRNKPFCDGSHAQIGFQG